MPSSRLHSLLKYIMIPLSSATSQTNKRAALFCHFPLGLLLPFGLLLQVQAFAKLNPQSIFQAGILQSKVEVREILAPVNMSKPVSLVGTPGNQVAPPDSYAMFRHLMEAKVIQKRKSAMNETKYLNYVLGNTDQATGLGAYDCDKAQSCTHYFSGNCDSW